MVVRRAKRDRVEVAEPGAWFVKIDRHRAGRAKQLQRIVGAGDGNAADEIVAVFKAEQVAAGTAERNGHSVAAGNRAGIDNGPAFRQDDPGEGCPCDRPIIRDHAGGVAHVDAADALYQAAVVYAAALPEHRAAP
jgi:hypothetical protein